MIATSRNSVAATDVRRLGLLALVALFGILSLGAAQALTVNDIPSPRPGGWVTDQAALLSADSIAQINALSDKLHAEHNAELLVVTIASLGNDEHRQFATDLFNHWALGDATADNGVLIYVAIEDRAAELILGDGIDSDSQVAISNSIMQEQMVPRFKRGDNEGAVLAGVRGVIDSIFRQPLSRLDAGAAAQFDAHPTFAAPPAANDGGGFSFSDLPSLSEIPPPQEWSLPAQLGGGGAGFAGIWIAVRKWLRNRPRKCKNCETPMQRLDESADNTHLSGSEQKEESLGSVDYDVWFCASCSHVLKQRYGAFFTSYSKCPKCRAVTKSSAETTLVSATYTSGGTVRVDERCQHCDYRNSFTRSTPQLTRSSSSSSSSSSSGGGGSSSGRGSSGRW